MLDNLALSCSLCNKHEGSDVASVDPVTGKIVPLFHPRRDHRSDHFQLDDADFTPLTPTGRVTFMLLHLNDPDRIEERKVLIEAGIFHLPK